MINLTYLTPEDWEKLKERYAGFFVEARARNLFREYQHYVEKIEVQGFDALNDFEKGRVEELRHWRKLQMEGE
jgi:hypothetical protein